MNNNGDQSIIEYTRAEKRQKTTDKALAFTRSGLNVGAAAVSPSHPLLALVGVTISEGLGLLQAKMQQKKIVSLHEQIQADTGLSDEEIVEKASDTDTAPVFIEAIKQVAADNATSERITRVAKIVASGFKDKMAALMAVRCLGIIDQMDDYELAVFCSFGDYQYTDPFRYDARDIFGAEFSHSSRSDLNFSLFAAYNFGMPLDSIEWRMPVNGPKKYEHADGPDSEIEYLFETLQKIKEIGLVNLEIIEVTDDMSLEGSYNVEKAELTSKGHMLYYMICDVKNEQPSQEKRDDLDDASDSDPFAEWRVEDDHPLDA